MMPQLVSKNAMKIINVSLFMVIVIAMFFVSAQAQAPPEPSPTPTPSPTPEFVRRRFAPSIGTGSVPGGATGLFTVYDGKTLQKRDFTFSLGYSNYDRDPGNVDISEIPVSVNYGLTDHVELFFNVPAYRGIKVNNPQNLSSFYLPNSQLFFGPNQLGSGPAFVLAPTNNRGITGALFRPANNQPFVQFPFVGQPTGNFGVGGAPPFSGTMGVQGTGGGAYSTANNFPGIGSVFGSILPGVVFSTNVVGGTASPEAFALAPTYLPEAPFVNRLYGESSFNSFTIGAKIRFSPRTNITNYGVIPFYRFYADKANSGNGFNMLQRGASPGANRGDFGLIGFLSHRFGNRLNLSGNLGYILNSNPTSQAFGQQKVTFLDRPDELVYGLGIDFLLREPWNEVVQPIAELRGTKYMGGRTPNALENSPVDLLLGSRFYLPLSSKNSKGEGSFFDNIGIGIAYRLHLNQQRGAGGGIINSGAVQSSENPHGFLIQLWIGRDRYVVTDDEKIDDKIRLLQNGKEIKDLTLGCRPGFQPIAGSCSISDLRITAVAQFKDQDRQVFKNGELAPIKWEAPTGTTVTPSEGETVTWDLSNLTKKGFYQLSATTTYKKGKPKTVSIILEVKECDCEPIPPITMPCPTSISVSNPDSVPDGTPATFTANAKDPPTGVSITYRWKTSAGIIIGRNDTQSITVNTTGLSGQTITATVTLGGLDPRCANTAQGDVTTARGDTIVNVVPVCKAFDRYGAITYNDEKARLDNFVIALNDDPSLEGYIIAYAGETLGRNIGTRKNLIRGMVPASYRIGRATGYIKTSRGYAKRVDSIDGGSLRESTVELYVCPLNATKPSPRPDITVGTSQAPEVGMVKRPTKRPKARLKVSTKKRRPVVGS
jgi:hypothetical protein